MVINGNLKFHTPGGGELQNAVMERLTTTQRDALTGGDLIDGRIIYNTTTHTYNFYDTNAVAWTTFATGGDASAVQTELDDLETALDNCAGM